MLDFATPVKLNFLDFMISKHEVYEVLKYQQQIYLHLYFDASFPSVAVWPLVVASYRYKVTVLPPGEWDPSIRIEPPPETPTSDNRWPNSLDARKNNDNYSLTGVKTGNSSDNNDEEDGRHASRYFLRSKA